MTETTRSERRYFTGLDSLRLGAFLLVFFFHSVRNFPVGYTGVMFFFVISSFLLTYLALDEIETSGRFHPGYFFIRRALRIYPLYYIVIGFAFFLLPYIAAYFNKPIHLPTDKWKYWLFLSNYDKTAHVFFLKQLWSIAAEEQFYIAFAILALFFRRYIFLICFLGLLLFSAYTVLGYNSVIETSYFNTIRYLPCFITGVLLAKIYFSYPQFLSGFTKWAFALSFILIPLSFIYPSLFIADSVSFSLLFGGIIALLLLKNNWLEGKNGNWIRFSEYWGKRTYGLYVYSGLVITLNITTLQIRTPGVKQLFELALTFLIAYLSYRFFEKPILQLKRKWIA